jgi:hypothetical protein
MYLSHDVTHVVVERHSVTTEHRHTKGLSKEYMVCRVADAVSAVESDGFSGFSAL